MQMNVAKRIEEGHRLISGGYDLNISIIEELLRISNNDACALTIDSYVLGYAQGVRATKAEMKRKGCVL